MTSSPSGWGECGRHARERRAHAPARGPPAAGRRSEVAGPGRDPRRAARGPCRCRGLGPAVRLRVLPRAVRAEPWAARAERMRPWRPGDGLRSNQTVAVAVLLRVELKRREGWPRCEPGEVLTPVPLEMVNVDLPPPVIFVACLSRLRGFYQVLGRKTGQCWKIGVDSGCAALRNLKVKLGHVGSTQPSLLGDRILLGKSLEKTRDRRRRPGLSN